MEYKTTRPLFFHINTPCCSTFSSLHCRHDSCLCWQPRLLYRSWPWQKKATDHEWWSSTGFGHCDAWNRYPDNELYRWRWQIRRRCQFWDLETKLVHASYFYCRVQASDGCRLQARHDTQQEAHEGHQGKTGIRETLRYWQVVWVDTEMERPDWIILILKTLPITKMQSTGSVISLRVTKSIDRTIRDASSVPIEERINYDCFSVIVCYCLFVYARLKNKFSRLVLFPSNGYTREKKKKKKLENSASLFFCTSTYDCSKRTLSFLSVEAPMLFRTSVFVITFYSFSRFFPVSIV